MANRLRDLRLAKGWSQDDLARRAGTSNQMISMLERGKRGLSLAWMQRLAKALGCEPADLLPVPDGGPVLPGLANDLPVLGTAAGNVSGAFQLAEGAPIGHVRRPPGVAPASRVYAVYVVGDSMSPEHRDGDLRFADPERPVAIGDSVIVQTRNFPGDPVQAYIKHLKSRDEEWLLLGQINPPGEIRISARTVTAVHRILSVNELFAV